MRCTRCETQLAAGTVEGFCPVCLLDAVLPNESNESNDSFHYDLIDEIARGGMGVVYRAVQHGSQRQVAVKMILAEHAATPEMLDRFRAEVEAVASLDHPHILPIYEAGEFDGAPFYSMKFADGGTLRERIAQYRRRFRETAKLIATIARAVHHAHQRGILHRDLKPGNILLESETNTPFVTDFGLAKWMAQDNRLTIGQGALGTPHYIAPEQAKGVSANLTTAADVYSLGAIFYELLAGRPPFEGATALETLRLVTETSPSAPRLIEASIPRDLEIICLKCLSAEPDGRYSSAAALADDLERWLDHRSILARPSSPPERLWRWAKRNPALATLSAVTLLLLTTFAIGSTIAAARIARSRDRAVAAETEATEKLWSSYLAQARASRATGRSGQRFDSLSAIAKAAQIHPNIETRNAAIASLALFDVRVARSWPRMHSRNPTSAFDATLERYACEEANGAIAIRRIADQQEIARLAGPGSRVEYIYAFSPDGKYLAAKFSGGATWLWRLADQRALLKLKGNPLSGEGWGAFSPQTGLCAFSLPQGGVNVYRLDELTGDNAEDAPPWRHWAEPSHAQGVAFDPTGDQIAICDVADGGRPPQFRERAGSVQVREVASRKVLWNFENSAGVSSAYWNSDGTVVTASSWDRGIHLLDAVTGAEVRVLRGHRDGVTMAKFNHAGSRLASAGMDAQLIFSDIRSGENLVSFPASEPTFVFAPDDRHIGVGLDDQTIGILEIAETRVCESLRPTNNPGRPLGLATSADGRFVASTGFTGSVVWNVARHTEAAVYPNLLGLSASAFVERDHHLELLIGNEVTGYGFRALPSDNAGGASGLSGLGDMRPWLAEKGWRLECISPDGRQAAFSPRGTRDVVLVAEIADPARRVELRGAEHPRGIVFSASGDLIACGSDTQDGVTVWNRAGQVVRKLELGEAAVAGFEPQGRWLLTGTRHGYRAWKIGSWEEGPKVDTGGGNIDTPAITFSLDGNYFAVLDQAGSIGLFSGATAEHLATLEAPFPIAPEFLLFSSDGRWLNVLGTDQTLQRWDLVALREELRHYRLDW